MSSIAVPEDKIYRAKKDSLWACMTCSIYYHVKEGDVVKCPKCSEKKS